MCLIIYKKRNIAFNKSLLTTFANHSFNKNKDSLGFMIKRKDFVQVGKGYPDPEELMAHLSKIHEEASLDKLEVVIHLRNASPNTAVNIHTAHPICSNFEENQKENFETKNVCVTHNGSFSEFRKYGKWINNAWENNLDIEGESDTTLFVKEYFSEGKRGMELLSYLAAKHPKKLSEFVGYSNKIVAFKAGYKTFLTGDFIQHEGYYFSNDSYKKPVVVNDFLGKHRTRIYESDVNRNKSNAYKPSDLGSTVYETEVFEEINLKYLSKPLSLKSRLYSHSIIPFGSCQKHGKCHFDEDRDYSKLCCKNLKEDDEAKKYRIGISQVFIDKKYEAISNGNKNIASILTFMYKHSDKISFFWAPCTECDGEGYSGNRPFECRICKGLGFKLGVLLKYDKNDKKIFSEVTNFVIKKVDQNAVIGFGSTSAAYINSELLISYIITYAKKVVDGKGIEKLETGIY